MEKVGNATTHNWILTAGFYGFVRIYCPCSKANEPWQKKYGVNMELEMFDQDKGCKSTSFKTTNALMDHLEDKDGILHKFNATYLKELFRDYWGNNIGHKGLYKLNSKEYKLAEAEEKRNPCHIQNNYEKCEAVVQLNNSNLPFCIDF